ncbi:deoxyhypusine synthase family protein [bacterium]|nr:deoxyhypusine synthase family protein [bacterium]
MRYQPRLTKKVKAIEVNGSKPVSNLLAEMAETGFQGKNLARVAEIWEKMVRNPDVTILMGYAGSLSTTGQWKLVNWLIERRFIDVLIPTGANVSEDIVDAMGAGFWQGDHRVDDVTVFKKDLNRYYDVYGREDDYMRMTEMIAEFILTLKENHPYTSREFFQLFGNWLNEKNIPSIVATAARCGVPIYCPAIADSPYGDAALIAKAKGFHFVLDAMEDYREFMLLADRVKDTGVVYVGGGVPKDFIQLFSVTSNLQFEERRLPNRPGGVKRVAESYYPHKYAIQITTDSPQWGGLSGCTFDEAMSWGKEDPNGDHVQVYCDATIALPIVTQAMSERIKEKRKSRNLVRVLKQLAAVS